ncbi:MAG: hypothetical protein ABR974_03685 [Bacteroidales bacterium]|jgi:hypothetical protein
MKFAPDRIERMIRLSVILIFSVHFINANSQPSEPQDTISRILKGSLILIKDFKYFITKDTTISIPTNLIKSRYIPDKGTVIFYDSLKNKASKTLFTKALFDLVIVRPDTVDQQKIINKSDDRFKAFSGVRIRKITIQRLNAFGANVSNPGYYQPTGTEKILNETHVNTRENVIRKNLIFNEGDSISPLKLADNERILRQLPYIEDARIIVVPVSAEEADIIVITKDVYSLGASYSFRGKNRGSFWLFDKNLIGSGHEFQIEVPYSVNSSDSPGIGLTYYLNNIKKSFANLTLSYYNGLGKRSYGGSLIRNLVSSETKYAGGITINQMYTSANLDTLPVPAPLYYNYQDYWLQRSFLVDRNTVTRIIGGIRFINDNIFERPQINPDSYYALQKKEDFLGSIAFSRQKFYKTNLVYSYGRAEDIPYGGLFRITGGAERNEFKNRAYLAADGAFGGSLPSIGYFQYSAGIGAFLRSGSTEQGVLTTQLMYISNLSISGEFKLRNFVTIDFTRGFSRYTDEYITILKENGFTGFSNDSLRGGQRVRLSLESVLFTPGSYLGFHFAFFGFADMAFLAGTKQIISNGAFVTGIGVGLRIRNDNLVFNTFQIRLGFFPNAPEYTEQTNLIISGEQQLVPTTFVPGPPALIPYR